MVVHRHREHLLRALLTDHVLIEDLFDLGGFRERGPRLHRFVAVNLLANDVVAEVNALIANVDRWARDELLHLFLRFPAE